MFKLEFKIGDTVVKKTAENENEVRRLVYLFMIGTTVELEAHITSVLNSKKDCIDNIDKYSYTEIEAKLAIQLVNSKPDLFSVTPAAREENTIATETNANNSQTAPNFALNDVAIGNNTPKVTSWTEALAAREA